MIYFPTILSSNIIGKLSPNIAIYRLVGTELKELTTECFCLSFSVFFMEMIKIAF